MKHQGWFNSKSIMAMWILLLALPVQAGELVLAWPAAVDAVTAGFEVEVRNEEGAKLQLLDVGDATSVVVTDLEDGVLYRFRVRPYDQWDNLSRESGTELVTLPAPRVDVISGQLEPGGLARVSIEGANFADGAWAVPLIDGISIEKTVVIRHDLAVVTIVSAPELESLGAEAVLMVNPVPKSEAYIRAHPQVLDLDRSGTLDAQDLLVLEGYFGVERNDPLFRPELDPTGDGVIDGEDLALVRGLMERAQGRVRGKP